jgi:hypothetical protein
MVDDTSKAILRKLFYDKRTGGRHLGLEDLKRGFPSHLKGDVDKKLKKLVKEILSCSIPHHMDHNMH